MSESIAISVENVSKAYRIWPDSVARLKSPFIRACSGLFPCNSTLRQKFEVKAASYYRDFFALKDITFQVRKGESVGIIGRNGSGKSTLLQIIAGTLQPTTGSVRVHGRVAALLELGSGFNPEFTGRENVHLNATVLGLSKAEAEARFDQVANFADIGDFIDQPVKTYSSGMAVRLAFAVQTAVNPDILIVDEALAVGDAFFQVKCISWLKQFQEQGGSLLVVTHDTYTVQRICNSAVLIDQGIQKAWGDCAEISNKYYALGQNTAESNAPPPPPSPEKRPCLGWRPLEINRTQCTTDGRAEIIAIESTENLQSCKIDSWLHLRMKVRFLQDMPSFEFGFGVRDRAGVLIGGVHSMYSCHTEDAARAGDIRTLSGAIRLSISPGTYFLIAGTAFHMGSNEWVDLCTLWDCALIKVTSNRPLFWGLARLETEIPSCSKG